MNAALAAKAQGDHVRAVDHSGRALAGSRDVGNRHSESTVVQCLGESCRALGDLAAALEWHDQAQRLCETLDDAPGVCEARIGGALCHARLGRTEPAQAMADTVLGQLDGELAGADVQARVKMLTGADDRDRLIQAIPEFRLVVDAHRRLWRAPAALD